MEWIGLIVSIAGVIASYIVARKYGDVAAVKASRKLHEEDIKKARLTALRSLLNELKRAQKVIKHNSELMTRDWAQSATRLPVSGFETAFVAGRQGVIGEPALLEAVTDYLAHADSVNSLVSIYIAAEAAGNHDSTEMAMRKIIGPYARLERQEP